MDTMNLNDGDPVLQRRARLAAFVKFGQRFGGTMFLVSILVFGWGVATGWTTLVTNLVIWSLLLGSVFLAPAIILGYAVRAADDADRDEGLLPPKE